MGWRYIAVVYFACALSCSAQELGAGSKFLPPGVSATDFLGDTLAVVAFCNLWRNVDQYELAMGSRFFGITTIDQKAVETARERQYFKYRSEITTISEHHDFCNAAVKHPFIVKVLRRGYPFTEGSDDRRQPEKIEFFGNMLGPVLLCKIPFDAQKWGAFLFEMGVKAESMPALNKQADASADKLKAANAPAENLAAYYKQVRENTSLARFVKR